MANVVTKTAKKTAKKATKKVVNGGITYAKGYLGKAFFCWFLGAVVAALPSLGINIPSMFTGQDTIAVAAFIIAGVVFFGKSKLSIGRAIALLRTFFV